MIQTEQADKFKNMLLNAGIIIFALFAAYSIFNAGFSNANHLKTKISEEEKKSSELEKISKIEKKLAVYRKLLAEKDTSEVMGDISDMAKESDVKVLSLKPLLRESASDYTKAIFDVAATAKNYDTLAKFINKIESYNNVYMVDSMDISTQPGLEKNGLTVSLKISSVSANQ